MGCSKTLLGQGMASCSKISALCYPAIAAEPRGSGSFAGPVCPFLPEGLRLCWKATFFGIHVALLQEHQHPARSAIASMHPAGEDWAKEKRGAA
jgi:hypothetical protein